MAYMNDIDRLLSEIDSLLNGNNRSYETYEDIHWAGVASRPDRCSGSGIILLSDEYSPDDEW